MDRYPDDRRTIAGIPVLVAGTYRDGAYWRWAITTIDGSEYIDVGLYTSPEDALKGLRLAYDLRMVQHG